MTIQRKAKKQSIQGGKFRFCSQMGNQLKVNIEKCTFS